uniref:Kazal-like domain-containing protein n=1 Tax=Megaselia scalaris TaxID=36166 RepID=T1GQ20_MEGSC
MLAALVSASDNTECRECPPSKFPLCATNGDCYKDFGNICFLEEFNKCKEKNKYSGPDFVKEPFPFCPVDVKRCDF